MKASPGTPAPISGCADFLMRTSLLSCDAWGAKAISQLCQIPSTLAILDPVCSFDALQLISQPWKARSAVAVPLTDRHRSNITPCSATAHVPSGATRRPYSRMLVHPRCSSSSLHHSKNYAAQSVLF